MLVLVLLLVLLLVLALVLVLVLTRVLWPQTLLCQGPLEHVPSLFLPRCRMRC